MHEEEQVATNPTPTQQGEARDEAVRLCLAMGLPDNHTCIRLAENYLNSRATVAGPGGDFQHRLFEECRTANWDPDLKNTFAEEIAHLHEELSEAFRAFRRYKDFAIREVNGKLEGVPIEFADALIGMFYNAELYGFDLLDAIERKHQFNLGRNYIEEGRQLHAPAAASSATPAERKLTYDQIDFAGAAEAFEEDDRYQALPLKWFVRPSPPRGYYIYEGASEGDEREAVAYVDSWSIADTIAEKHNARLATPAPAESGQAQCADCLKWIARDENHTCSQQVRRNKGSAKR